MKKKIIAALCAALLVLALPTAALAWVSPQGNTQSNDLTITTAAGVTVRAKAAAAKGSTHGCQLVMTDVTGVMRAENTPSTAELEAMGYTEIASFRVNWLNYIAGHENDHVGAEGDEGTYSFSYNIGSEYANADVIVYVEHEEEGVENEVVNTTASSDGTLTFSTDKLSIHTIVAKKSSNAGAKTNSSNKSPQTGVATLGIAGVAVAAAGAAVVAYKKSNE